MYPLDCNDHRKVGKRGREALQHGKGGLFPYLSLFCSSFPICACICIRMYMCVYKSACEGLILMLKITFNYSFTLFIVIGPLSQTQSLSIWVVLPACSRDLLSLPSRGDSSVGLTASKGKTSQGEISSAKFYCFQHWTRTSRA